MGGRTQLPEAGAAVLPIACGGETARPSDQVRDEGAWHRPGVIAPDSLALADWRVEATGHRFIIDEMSPKSAASIRAASPPAAESRRRLGGGAGRSSRR